MTTEWIAILVVIVSFSAMAARAAFLLEDTHRIVKEALQDAEVEELATGKTSPRERP